MRLVLIRHAEPLKADGSPPDEWPLSEQGRHDAGELGRRLADGSTTTVYTSPERKARHTAAHAFPSLAAHVRRQLREVRRPWYAEPDELVAAASCFLMGDAVEGWERRQDVVARLPSLNATAPTERIVMVTHGLLLSTWLHHEVGLEDPLGFWSDLRMPDAWELDREKKTIKRVE